MALGLYTMAAKRRPLLWLTAGIAVAQQAFNLFSAIGDIAVYYIPLYAIGAIWAGYGAAGLAEGLWLRPAATAQSSNRTKGRRSVAGTVVVLLLLLLPLTALARDSRHVDQSGDVGTRAMWEEISSPRFLRAIPSWSAMTATRCPPSSICSMWKTVRPASPRCTP